MRRGGLLLRTDGVDLGHYGLARLVSEGQVLSAFLWGRVTKAQTFEV